MAYGIRKGLEDIAYELKGIKHILSAMWSSRYQNDETDVVHPDLYADEYISTEECARRLGITDQTIRNWILTGKRKPSKGWVQNVHYVNLSPSPTKRDIIRIPWNQLILSFAKNTEITLHSFRSPKLYRDTKEQRLNYGAAANVEVEENNDQEDLNEESI